MYPHDASCGYTGPERSVEHPGTEGYPFGNASGAAEPHGAERL